MFFRTQGWITFVIFLTIAPYNWAGVSQTTRFTLSVTIPEHTQAPAEITHNPNTSSPLNSDLRINVQKELRNNTPVEIRSYVVD